MVVGTPQTKLSKKGLAVELGVVATPDITALLQQVSDGDSGAQAKLMSCVYDELHRLARRSFRQERAGNTLQPTALVNEAYLRLAGRRNLTWQSRAHFFASAARLMRRILVDHARAKGAARRGGLYAKISFEPNMEVPQVRCSQITDLDEALERLSKFDPRLASVVELRFFGGMTEDEIGEVLGVSARTVKRDWVTARAWLHAELMA